MGRVWAIAVNTVRQAVRLKIAATFIVLLLVLLPVMGFKVTGDGTLKGRLQTFISYGLSLTAALLYLLTIIASVFTLTNDVRQKQIFTVLTKPIRRFEIITGKFLGIVLLNLMLLVLFSAIIYGFVVNMPLFVKSDETETKRANNEFFAARKALTPQEADVSKEVDETYEKLKRSGQLPEGLDEIPRARRNYKAEMSRRAKLAKRAAAVGNELVWEFHNVRLADANQSLFIRYKYDVAVNPPDMQVFGRWFVGDDRQVRYGMGIETPLYTFDRKDAIRTATEIEIPGDCVAGDGYVAVGFLNPPLNETTIIFPPEDGLEILYKADTFTANFVRAMLLIGVRLVFLAALGVFAGAFLSFPVAILLSLAVFFVANVGGFILESFEYVEGELNSLHGAAVKTIIQLLPQFDKVSTSTFLVGGRLLSWSLLARQAIMTVCVEATLLLAAAILIFRFREIAKTTL